MIWALIFFKHLVCDWFLQPPYMWKNKGTWMHPGGLLHAGVHAVGMLLVLLIFTQVWIGIAIILALLDGIAHYLIDFVKMNFTDKMKLGPESPYFWQAIGVDQFLHYMTYLGIVSLL